MEKVFFAILSLFTLFILALSSFTFLREQEYRAVRIGGVFTLAFLAFVVIVFLISSFTIFWLGLFFLFLIFVSVFLPFTSYREMTFSGEKSRYDERDIMFARARYKKGTPEYRDYYQRHPERQKEDEAIRNLPELCEPGGAFYEPVIAQKTASLFDLNKKLIPYADGQPAEKKNVDKNITAVLKNMAYSMGAVDVGMTRLKKEHVYSHIGRGPGTYGQPIDLDHSFVIVFAVEMDYRVMQKAPQMPVAAESAEKYLQAGTIAVAMAKFIRAMGYEARAHTDTNYRIIVPAVAQDAGLGEVGRIGLLIHSRYGPRIRLAAVSTTLPVQIDQPIPFGVQDFCRACKKCATNCPSGAISHGLPREVRGVTKWSTNQEACYRFWRLAGTDCGICLRVCPYSKPHTLAHNFVRFAIKKSPAARYLAVWADDLFYGHNPVGEINVTGQIHHQDYDGN